MDFSTLTFALYASTADPAFPVNGTGYDNDIELGFRIQHDAGPFLAVGWDKGHFAIEGQGMTSYDSVKAGIGYAIPLTDQFTVEVSGGIWRPVRERQSAEVIEEMTLSTLGDNHSGPWLAQGPFPLTEVPEDERGWSLYESCEGQAARGREPNFDYCFGQTFTTDWSPYVRVDLGFTPRKHLRFSVFYEHLAPETQLGLWDDGTFATGEEFQAATGAGWWRDIFESPFHKLGIEARYAF